MKNKNHFLQTMHTLFGSRAFRANTGIVGTAFAFALILAGFFVSVSQPAQAQFTTGWKLLNSYYSPSAVGSGSNGVHFTLNDKGYATFSDNTFREYTPSGRDFLGVWVKKDSYPGTTPDVAFAINDKGYVTTAKSREIWQFDPSRSAGAQWVRMRDYPGTLRQTGDAIVIGGKAYIVGGSQLNPAQPWDTTNYYGSPLVWEFDPAGAGGGTWTRKNDVTVCPLGNPQTFGQHSGQWFERSGKGYILCRDKTMWEYAPATDSWVQKANFPGSGTNRLWSVTWQMGDKGYVVGGWGAAQYKCDLWEYSLASNVWQKQSNMPNCTTATDTGTYARGLAGGFVIDDAGYLFGGVITGNAPDDFWRWTKMGPSNRPIANIVLPTGNVTTVQGQPDIMFLGEGKDSGGVNRISPVAYEWREGTCDGPLLSNDFYFYLPTTTAGTRKIYLSVQDASGAWSVNCPSRTITVTPSATLTFSAFPPTIPSGGTSTLSWSTSPFVTSCWATNGISASGIPTPGWTNTWQPTNSLGYPVTPSGTTTYTLECWDTNSLSTGPKSVTVTVGATPPPTPSTLKVCQDTCNSNIPRGQGGNTTNFSLTQGATQDLVACFNPAPVAPATNPCSDLSGDVTATAVWTENNVSGGAISLSSAAGKERVTGNSVGTERFTTTYNGNTATMDVSVSCAPTNTCNANPQSNQVCSSATYTIDNGCGVMISCQGTRNCDYNWREVAP